MYWMDGYFWIGLILSFLTVLLGIRNFLHKEKEKVFLWSYIGLFFSAYILLIPFSEGDGFYPYIYTFYNAVRVFSGDFDLPYMEIKETIGGTDWGFWLPILLSCIYVCALGLTLTFVASFLPKVNLWIKQHVWFYSKRPLYVFSVLDKRTIITGKDIRKKKKEKEILIYINSNPDQDDIEYLKEECEEIGALLIEGDIKNFEFKNRKGNTSILLAKENDIENVQDFVDLIDEKRLQNLNSQAKNSLYIFSSTEEYELIIRTFETNSKEALKNIRVITVDEISNIVYSLFSEHPLFENLTAQDQTIRLLIVGNTRLAKLLVRTAVWMGQMEKFKLEIDYFCNDAELTKSEFKFLYPEIIDKEKYDIDFYDLSKPVHIDKIKELNPTYIVVAHENELLNLQTGIELSTSYKRRKLKHPSLKDPIIALWNASSNLDKQIEELQNHKKQKFSLIPFGSTTEQYSYDTVFNSRMNRLGYGVNLFYNGKTFSTATPELEEDFYTNEYDRKSSIASAHHVIYKLEDLKYLVAGEKIDTGDPNQLKALQKNQEIVTALARIEHKRWMGYMRSIGYRVLPLDKLKELYLNGTLNLHFSEEFKVHACLVDWDPLIGNPLKKENVSFEEMNASSIEEKLKDPNLDDLDRVTLTNWLLVKTKYKNLKEDDLEKEEKKSLKKMKKNFKTVDEDILRLLFTPEIFEEDHE